MNTLKTTIKQKSLFLLNIIFINHIDNIDIESKEFPSDKNEIQTPSVEVLGPLRYSGR